MFGFGRQNVSTYDATLASGRAPASTAIGTSRFWPDAWSVASQIAAWVGVPVHCATVAAIDVLFVGRTSAAGSATASVPVSGSTAPAIGSRTRICAVAVPSDVPAAWPVVSE